MKKVIEILLSIFSIGILIALFAGALSFVGYILALCIAGTTATNICTFILRQVTHGMAETYCLAKIPAIKK